MHIILYGGGLDSTALFLFLNRHYRFTRQLNPIELLHVAYGQKAALAERHVGQYFADKYGAKFTQHYIDMSYSKSSIMRNTAIGDADSNRLELRNLLLISFAASYAASKYEWANIHVGFHAKPEGRGFPDARSGYLQGLQDVIKQTTDTPIKLEALFKDLTRQEILEFGYNLDKEIITHSHTCYEEVPCGKCVHCVEKRKMVDTLLWKKEIEIRNGDKHAS